MVFGCVSNINCEAGGSAGTHYVELKGSNVRHNKLIYYSSKTFEDNYVIFWLISDTII